MIKEDGIKHDNGKLQMSLLPFESLEEITKVLEYGAKKYSKDNWKFVPEGKTRYEDAMLRHFSAYKRGEEFDEESGLKHLHHMACNALFLIWFDLKND